MPEYSGTAHNAWTEMIKDLLSAPGGELKHVSLCVNDFSQEPELFSKGTRNRLDEHLRQAGKPLCNTVSNTIFPMSLWSPGEPRSTLYSRYSRIWPKIKRYRENRYGVYFRRMTAYGSDSKSPINQVEKIIQIYNSGNHRRSAGQIEIYDPSLDLVNARQRGFPCLRNIAVIPENGHLDLVGQYITQYAISKSYGNLMGLCNLARFLAHYMNLELRSVQSHALIETLETSKSRTRLIL